MAAPTWGRWPSSSPALTTWSWTRSVTSPTSSRSRLRSPSPGASWSTTRRPAPSRPWWAGRGSKGVMFVYFAPQSELNSSDSIFSKHERKEERERERREKKERRRERKEKKLRKLQLQKNVSSSTEESPKVGTYAEFVIYILLVNKSEQMQNNISHAGSWF